MKAIVPTKTTVKQKKAMEVEIRRQCVEQTRKYETELDAVMLFVLHTEFGFGKQRLEKFYDKLFSVRREMQERFQMGEDDDFAIDYFLKQDGIDVQAMYNAQEGKEKFKVRLR